MQDEQRILLSLCGRPPARLTAEQTAMVLGFQPHDMAILVKARLLKPLGKPARNGVKMFGAESILKLARDSLWLDKATETVRRIWWRKNHSRGGSADDDLDGDAVT